MVANAKPSRREPLDVELRRFASACEKETGLTIAEVRKAVSSGQFNESALVSRWLQADRMLEWLDDRDGQNAGRHTKPTSPRKRISSKNRTRSS